MTRLKSLILAAALALGGAQATLAQTPGEAGHPQTPRAVVELFTSQGCSSCPPADELLARLAREPDIVALSLHVDYWDYLGWKDTLGNAVFSERQRGYASRRRDGQVYTPQAVVAGVAHALGSDRAAIEKAIDKARGKFSALTVPVSLAEMKDKVQVRVDGPVPAGAQLWILGVAGRETVRIARGENKGREATYVNVVKQMTKVADVTAPASFDIPLAIAKPAGCDGYVALIQMGNPNEPQTILGAAKGGTLAAAAR